MMIEIFRSICGLDGEMPRRSASTASAWPQRRTTEPTSVCRCRMQGDRLHGVLLSGACSSVMRNTRVTELFLRQDRNAQLKRRTRFSRLQAWVLIRATFTARGTPVVLEVR